MSNEDISAVDAKFAALTQFLGKSKDVNTKVVLQGYLLPLLQEMRAEVADAFEIIDERIDELEEDSVNSQAAELVDDAKTVLEHFFNVLNDLMLKHEYIANNDYTENADPVLRQKHGTAVAAMVEWFGKYKRYEAAQGDDDDDDDDGDDGGDDDGEDGEEGSSGEAEQEAA